MANWRKLLWISSIVAAAFLAACGGKPKYPACDGDKDCKAPEKCVNKKCVMCAADADCGEGKMCSNGSCEPLPGWCASDNDCDPSQTCKDHKCTFCTADTECGVGGQCRAGKCLRKGMCDKDTDCAEDEDCVGGRCQKYQRPTANLPTCPLDPVFFGFDVYLLSDDAKTTLQKDFDCLNANKGHNFAVVGYTDPRGTVEYNISLSDDRAQAVATYLARLGIDPVRMHKVPKGSSESKGSDESGWAHDRRVEIVWE
jgi:peptidoglycan-associated lipoprotein